MAWPSSCAHLHISARQGEKKMYMGFQWMAVAMSWGWQAGGYKATQGLGIVSLLTVLYYM
jgi:hypothetical protein